MTRRLDALAAGCSHLAPLLLMYRQVSEEVAKSVAARRYQEPGYVAHLDAVFATLYFHAIDSWNSGNRAAVPRVWGIAFSAAAAHRVSPHGDMLLGMNAHISRDLAYAILERVETTIDNNATVRWLLILAATSYSDPARDTIARDRYCSRATKR